MMTGFPRNKKILRIQALMGRGGKTFRRFLVYTSISEHSKITNFRVLGGPKNRHDQRRMERGGVSIGEKKVKANQKICPENEFRGTVNIGQNHVR